jgi:protein subunit release factor A
MEATPPKIRPQTVPEDLIRQLDAANQRFSQAKQHLEAAVESTGFDHQESIEKRTEEFRAAERELEEITRQIEKVLTPTGEEETKTSADPSG